MNKDQNKQLFKHGYGKILSRRDLISVELNETNDLVPLGTIYE